MHTLLRISWIVVVGCFAWPIWLAGSAVAQTRYATSDNLKGYVHWIELYDDNNARIDPVENPNPYSPEKTCGRCHNYKTIAHGWHFNAALTKPASDPGRAGTPLIWSDSRTGTHLPLSYRGWQGTHQPADLGISTWQIAAKFGGFLPGMAPGVNYAAGISSSATGDSKPRSQDRSSITGPLVVDCLMCHHRPGSGYSPFGWTEQIQDQNFAYAPTAALGIGVISGNLRRLKDDADLSSSEIKEQLPKVSYQADKFRSDKRVFIDLMREPASESCNYCHTSINNDAPKGGRWMHDDDVHTRAGLSCADCHRNSLDHETVRGFEGEHHLAGAVASTLSCQGCHLGSTTTESAQPGRFGAPRPLHHGLPPLHFDKLSCTACHAGQAPAAKVGRLITSMSHQLGSHIKRSGDELPAVFGSVYLPEKATQKYTPHRLIWPSFWGVIKDGVAKPINPDQAYELIRKPLKVRKEFAEELVEVKLTLGQRSQILGDDKAARMKFEELSEAQQQLITTAEQAERKKQIEERIAAALAEIENAYEGLQAVYVDAGSGLVRNREGQLTQLTSEQLGINVQPYKWPTAHAVRPVQQSLGVTGCNECHGNNSPFFYADVTTQPMLPALPSVTLKVHQLQKADMERLANWSRLFEGRTIFKVISVVALGLTGLVVLSKLSTSLNSPRRS